MDQALTTKLPRVFFVEDSHLVLDRLMTLLAGVARSAGYAESAAEAIEAILVARPDAVVLDLKLAHGSGIDVLRALQVRAPEIGIYMLTNHPAAHYRRLAVDLGARGFYDKSTEFDRVRDDIAALAYAHAAN